MKIKGESTSVKVLPLDPFAAFNVAVLIYLLGFVIEHLCRAEVSTNTKQIK
jgi:hypothetical protein